MADTVLPLCPRGTQDTRGKPGESGPPPCGRTPIRHQIYCLLYLHRQVEIPDLRKQGSQENLPTDLCFTPETAFST